METENLASHGGPESDRNFNKINSPGKKKEDEKKKEDDEEEEDDDDEDE